MLNKHMTLTLITLLIVSQQIVSTAKIKSKNSNKTANSTQPKKNRKAMESQDKFGGDMAGAAPPQTGVMRKAASQKNLLWPNGVVFYKIDGSLANRRNSILSAMRHIEAKTCVKFKPRSNQKNYVQFFNGEGCYSSVGRVGGRQYLSLGRGCYDVGSALHEILHALGFYHEHMRTDRDQYIKIQWENIENGMRDQFAKVPASRMRLYTKFDFNSIMIYGTKAFSKNGRNTMTPKVKGARMVESHFKKALSPADITSVNKYYSCDKLKRG